MTIWIIPVVKRLWIRSLTLTRSDFIHKRTKVLRFGSGSWTLDYHRAGTDPTHWHDVTVGPRTETCPLSCFQCVWTGCLSDRMWRQPVLTSCLLSSGVPAQHRQRDLLPVLQLWYETLSTCPCPLGQLTPHTQTAITDKYKIFQINIWVYGKKNPDIKTNLYFIFASDLIQTSEHVSLFRVYQKKKNFGVWVILVLTVVSVCCGLCSS